MAPPSSDQSTPSSAPLAGSLCTSSSAFSGPASDSAVSGLFLFTETDYPVDGAFIQLVRRRNLVRPVVGHPAARSWDGLILGSAIGRREFGPVVVLVGSVVPEPVLAGFEGPDDRMSRRAPVRGSVARQRVVAATDMAARGAPAQVHPPAADRVALDTAGATRRHLGINVSAHEASLPTRSRGAGQH